MQHVQRFVELYFQYVRVTGNEELRRLTIEQSAHRRVVVARIAAYMLDEHVNILAFETVQFAIHESQITSVAVATHSPKRAKSRQFISHFHRADVACVPYLVARFEIVQIFWIPIGMGVADDADFFHFSEW